MTGRRFRIIGNGGVQLACTCWSGATVRAVVVFAHGYTAHVGSYGEALKYLISRGHSVYALDHRGHGSSEGKRASLNRFDDLVEDFESLVRVAQKEHLNAPVFSMGHSLGGLIVTRHALSYPNRLSGVVSVSPALVTGAAFPDHVVSVLRGLSRVVPNLPIVPFGGSLEDDGLFPPMPAWKDVFSYHGKTRLNMAREIFEGGRDALARMDQLSVPVLFQHGTADLVTNPRGSELAFETALANDRSLELWSERHHNLLTDDGWEDVLYQAERWIEDRAGR
ncbi:alpha/beta hydrolase [soil metagenome]